MMELTYEQALNRAAALCSKGEHCAFDILKKMSDWGVSAADGERILLRLREDRFIDDARFVHAFVHDKYIYQHWGRVKIRYALLQKRLPSPMVDIALDEIIGVDDYQESLLDLLRVKMRNMSLPLVPNDRARLYRFAAQRGYEPGVVSKVLQQLNAGNDEED